MELEKDKQDDFLRETEDATITLQPSEASYIKGLIETNTTLGLIPYLQKVGFQSSNFYAIMGGKRAITLKLLNKLLSGIGYEFICKQEFVALQYETGPSAETVCFGEPEEGLLLDVTQDQENESTSSS